MIKKFNEHVEMDYDPDEIIPLVGLPSGQYIETKRKNYSRIQQIANWSEKYRCYVFRDKDYTKILYLLDTNEYSTDDDEAIYMALELRKYGIKNNYKINKDKLTLYGDLVMKDHLFITFPIKIYEIKGDFVISRGKLETLKNLPRIIRGNFDCSYNILENLHNSPIEIDGYYDCSHNNLTTLRGCPSDTESFNCSYNRLTTLEYCPTFVSGDFDCSHNQLKNIENSPISVKGTFYCRFNEIDSLKGKPRDVVDIISDYNPMRGN